MSLLFALNENGTLSFSVGETLADVDRSMTYATLLRHKGKKEPTAVMLGVSLKTLYNRLALYRKEAPEVYEIYEKMLKTQLEQEAEVINLNKEAHATELCVREI